MAKPLFPRDLLEKHFPGDYRMIAAFEEQEQTVDANSTGVAATAAIKDASVLVLSGNSEFTNEYVVQVGDGLSFRVDAGTFTIFANVTGIILAGDIATKSGAESLSNKTLAAPSLSGLGNYANDAAAATGGVPIGGVYRNGSVIQVRVT